jgi:hypothetical protein
VTRNMDSDFVFVVMYMRRCSVENCYTGEHAAVDSVYSDRVEADDRASVVKDGFVITKYVRSLAKLLS